MDANEFVKLATQIGSAATDIAALAVRSIEAWNNGDLETAKQMLRTAQDHYSRSRADFDNAMRDAGYSDEPSGDGGAAA